MVRASVILGILLASGAVLGQSVDMFDPTGWFMSDTALFAAATMLSPWVVKILTALGKRWLNTDGWQTNVLSGIIAILLAGIGGGLGLGMFSGLNGFDGVWRAMVMIGVGWVGSTASHAYDTQLEEKAVKQLTETRLKIK